MEKVDDSDCVPSYYLPHHGVFKLDSTTTQLRVVFNGSSISSNGRSLNDNLYIGPTLQQDLVALITKWRFYKYVFSADITKMYRQILVHQRHTNFQRIILRDSENGEIQDYRLKTVTFGVNCAPYLALRTLLQLADDEEKSFPIGAKILREAMYVDDALVGAHSVEDALEARDQLIGILKTAMFDLRKWTSNTKEILEDLPLEDLLSSSFVCLEEDSRAKMLGVRWNAASDCFYFVTEVVQVKSSYTKRQVLSMIARIFDPAGWLAPIIITAKILMQQMWLDRIQWDEPIKPLALQKWLKFITNFDKINLISIPRWIKFSPSNVVQIHGFCDSSELAYAATVYVRIKNEDGVFSNLLISKTKVAPIKKVSLPRLELCGATLLANLIENVRMKLKQSQFELFLWSDSTIVLAWLRKSPNCWKTFVANRVSSILGKVGNIEWRHVVSNCNPADLATRGLTPSELKDNKLWWHGPEWLILDENNWPISVTEFQTSSEEKRSQSMFAKSSEIADSSLKASGGKPEETEKVTGDSGEPLKAKEKPKVQDFLSNISTFQKAIHVVARMYRFVSLARKSDSNPEMLSSEELSMARKGIFIWSQKQYFSKDYACLTAKTRLSPKSPLICLNPFLDQAGIIRANGRLGSTTCLTYNERHPVILAYESRIARLYVEFVHKITCHGGIRLVMTTVRLECWVIRLKNLVKSVIHNCKVCVLHRQKLMQQIMSVLPPERTTLSRAFTNTGVDFAGPIEIKSFTGRYSRITKGYVCLFVCFATKAIHLEAVSDLSTPAFLAALDRFVARRGCPNSMYSDNGRNFVGAARQIDSNFAQQVKSFKDEAVNKFGHQRLSWHFIPAAAPHMGGLWESGVKSFKTHFKKLSGQLKYTFEEFSTLLATIEACLNSRPLGSMSEDVEDLQALTPAHFLIGSSMLTPAEPEEIKPVSSIFNRWRKLKAMHHDICRRWKEEYLVELHKRYKWKNPRNDLIVGDLVALKGESLCSTDWRLGRIVKVYHGSDDKVRVVDLKTQGGIITRPIHKLVLLPRSSQI